MATEQEPGKDSVTHADVAISTSNEYKEEKTFPTYAEGGSTKEYNEIYEHLTKTFNTTLKIINELPEEEKLKAIKDIDDVCQQSLTRIKEMKRSIDIKKERGGEDFHHKVIPVQGKELQLLSSKLCSVGLIEVNEGIKTISTGTGFLVGDGYFMTAYHVLKDRIAEVMEEIMYGMPRGSQYDEWLKKILDTDKHLDKKDAVYKYLEKQRPMKPLQQLVESFRSFDEKECQKTLEKIEKRWCKECVVKFGVGLDHSDKSPVECSFCIDIPFADEESDMIILRIQRNTSTVLPTSFLLDEGTPKHSANIIGYIEDASNQQNIWVDQQCKVYVPKKDDDKLEGDIKAAIEWWKTQEKVLSDQSECTINIDNEYKGCSQSCRDKFGCLILHTAKSFVHGTSGSPVINVRIVEGEKHLLVSAMYQRGYPLFYYELQHKLQHNVMVKSDRSHFNIFQDLVKNHEENNVINLKYFFEAGITMKHVAGLLDKYSSISSVKKLRKNIFGKEANRAPVDVPDSATNGEDLLTKRLEQEKESIPVQTSRRFTSCDGEPFAGKSIKVGSLPNRILRHVAKQIPKEWRSIMNFLELPQLEIDTVSSNYPRDVEECAYRCLEKWRNKNATLDSVVLESELIDALKFENRMDVIQYLEEKFGITGKRNSSETTNRTESTVVEEDNGKNALSSLGIQEDEQ